MSTAALASQNVQVRRTHIDWVPTEEMGCFDHFGCTKKIVKVAAVTLVQQAENLRHDKDVSNYAQIEKDCTNKTSRIPI